MKVKVLTKFKDKHTKKIYAKGTVLEVTEERFAEILQTGPLVEKVEEPEEKPKATTSKKGAK